MGDTNNTKAIVYDGTSGKQIATIVLNGYNIAAGGPLGKVGAMRSFRVETGDLWDVWDAHLTLAIHAEDGRIADGRVAALPAEEGSFGLIEFL
jgi:hypothetical protein